MTWQHTYVTLSQSHQVTQHSVQATSRTIQYDANMARQTQRQFL